MTDTSPRLREDLSVDQQLAQFATASSVPTYLPLAAERFARQRLQALDRVEDHHRDGRPVALFLCTHNAGRSQMALGFFTHLAGDHAVGRSGTGSNAGSAACSTSCTSPSADNPPHPRPAPGSGTSHPWERTD